MFIRVRADERLRIVGSLPSPEQVVIQVSNCDWQLHFSFSWVIRRKKSTRRIDDENYYNRYDDSTNLPEGDERLAMKPMSPANKANAKINPEN